MLTKNELLIAIQSPESLDALLNQDSGKKIFIRRALSLYKPIEHYIDNNNPTDLLNLIKAMVEHLSIIDGKDDGYSKRQCLEAIIYAVNLQKNSITEKLVQFFNLNLSATEKDITYLTKKLSQTAQYSFILDQNKITQKLLKPTPEATTEILYIYDENLAQDLKTVSKDLQDNQIISYY